MSPQHSRRSPAWGRAITGQIASAPGDASALDDEPHASADGTCAKSVETEPVRDSETHGGLAPEHKSEPGPPRDTDLQSGVAAETESDESRHSSPAAVSAWAALIAAFLAVLGFGGGILTLTFLFIAPGLSMLAPLRVSARAVVSLAVPVSLGTLMLGSALSLWVGVWDPLTGTRLVQACVLATALIQLLINRRALLPSCERLARRVQRARAPDRYGYTWWALAVVTVVVWVFALNAAATAEVSPYGLLTSGQPLLIVALALPVLLLVLAVRRSSFVRCWVAIVLAVLTFRTAGPVLDEVPRYPWTYKHIGATDAISTYGSLIPGVDIYHDWPGFFSGAAWLSSASGIGVLSIATWTTPVVCVLFAMSVAYLARQLGADPITQAVAGFIAVTMNWVGQDYFAPQAIAIVFAPLILALAMRARTSMAAGLGALGLFAAMTVSHQLTPVWVLIVLWALVVMKQSRIWVPVVASLIVAAQVAPRIELVESYGVFSGGDVLENATSNIGPIVTDAQALLSLLSRATALSLWLLAAIVVVLQLRRRRPWAAAAVIAFSPMGLLVMQNYGGEAILRVYLYAIIGCSVLIAGGLTAMLRRSWPLAALGTGGLVVAVAMSAQAYFGPWFAYQVTAAEVSVSEDLLNELPQEARIATAVPAWPDRTTAAYVDRERWFWAFDATGYSNELTGSDLSTPQDVATIEAGLLAADWVPIFFVVSDKMQVYSDLKGLYAPNALDNLEAQLAERDGWTLVGERDDVRVWRYVSPEAEWAPAASWTLPPD